MEELYCAYDNKEPRYKVLNCICIEYEKVVRHLKSQHFVLVIGEVDKDEVATPILLAISNVLDDFLDKLVILYLMCCHPRRYLTFVSIFNQVCNLLLELPVIFLSYSWRSWGEILILVIFNLFFKRNIYVYIYIIKKCGRGPKTLTVDPNYIMCIFFKVKWEFSNLRTVAWRA